MSMDVYSPLSNSSSNSGPTAIATTVVDATCGTSNGSITLGTVTGGVAPYIYSVDGSPFTGTTGYSNLAAGSHPIQVKDANGCIFAASATVADTGGPTAIVTNVTVPPAEQPMEQ